MCQSVGVLVETDDVNKIYYIEDKSFALNDRDAINLALAEYYNLFLSAKIKGYQIINRTKNIIITPMDDGTMTSIDEPTIEFGSLGRRPK